MTDGAARLDFSSPRAKITVNKSLSTSTAKIHNLKQRYLEETQGALMMTPLRREDHETHKKIVISLHQTVNRAQIEQKRTFVQRFAFCFGCEEAVLQGNFQLHEQSCSSLIAIMQLPFDQLWQAVCHKKETIHKQLTALLQTRLDKDSCYLDRIRKTLNGGEMNFGFISRALSICSQARLGEVQRLLVRLQWVLQIQDRMRRLMSRDRSFTSF